jgi:DNA primase
MDLVQYVESLGVKLHKSGHGLRGLCPLHKEETPSFFVNKEKQWWHCFGCGHGGNIYELIMLVNNCSIQEAIGLIGSDPIIPHPIAIIAKQEVITSELIDRMTIATYTYSNNLALNRKALTYIINRGITGQTIMQYQLGWCRNVECDMEEPLGKDGIPKLRERITVPCIWKNHVVFIQGRSIDPEIKPKYIGLHLPKPLFGYNIVENQKEIYLVEGVFDWLTLLQWNIPAVCPLGANLSASQTALLLNKAIVCCQDADIAGDAAAEKIAREIPRTRRLRPPELYKDWNDWLIAGATKNDFIELNESNTDA